MKNKRTPWILAACAGMLLLAGCGGEKREIYEQAGRDLERGSYEQALSGYEASVANEMKLPQSYRGAGIANLRLGNYQAAIEDFTSALGCEKVSKSLAEDILSYRVTAKIKAGLYEEAMADCQVIAQEYDMDADTYFLTGKAALELDAYGEAENNFDNAYVEESTYDMAIRIYQAYLEKDMEADGTRYLEAALATEPKDAEDYCDRGRVYYYMEDYANAQQELIKAANDNSTEALLLLGMVYLAQEDVSNARAMYQDYVSREGESARGYNGLALCDIAEGNYSAALGNISTGLPLASTEEMRELLFNELVAYEKMLDFATARDKAEAYLDMFHEDAVVEKELVFLNSRVNGAVSSPEAAEAAEGAAVDGTAGSGAAQ